MLKADVYLADGVLAGLGTGRGNIMKMGFSTDAGSLLK